MALTLPQWLRTRSPAQLGSLLVARPEAAVPPEPHNLSELADRLTIPASLTACLHRLPAPALHIIEVLQVLGPGGGDRQALAGWLGCEPDHPGLAEALAILANHALAWPDDPAGASLRLAKPLYQAFRFPLGLGPSAALLLPRYSVEQLRPIARNLGLASHGRRPDLIGAITTALGDADGVRKLVAQAPPATRHRLQTLAETGRSPDQSTGWYGYQPPDPTLAWAIERGLVIPDSLGTALPPREVALALRGPDWRVPFRPYQPDPAPAEAAAEAVAQEAAAAAGAALEQLASLLAVIDASPVALLKTGGVGVKELRRLARATGLEEPAVRLFLELAYEAELVELVLNRAGGGELLPTSGYDEWTAAEPAGRLATILPVWAMLPAAPLAGPPPGESKRGPALTREPAGQLAYSARAVFLGLINSLPPGRAVTDESRLIDAAEWLAPLLMQGVPEADQLVTAAWREATLLGVVSHGANSPLGEALLSGDREALATACQKLLPAPTKEAIFQADLTAFVPGPPERALAQLLDATADRESGGGAVTWRFTPGSVRRAMDAGYQSDQLVAALQERAVGRAVPQPLAYLVQDVARRHGAIRVRGAECVLRVADQALAAELAGARSLQRLRLTLVSPTVLTAATPIEETLSVLRDAGFAPVTESADGVPQLEQRKPRRAGSGPRRRWRGVDRHAPPAAPLALAERLLAAPLPAGRADSLPAGPAEPWEVDDELVDALDLAGEMPQDEPELPAALAAVAALAERASHLSDGERQLLAHAIETAAPVTIGYTNAQGGRTTRTIDTAELVGPHLVAWCQLRDDERMFALHRIDSVAPAT